MKLIEKNFYLNQAARDAYRSYLQSYASHGQKDVFNVNELDLQGIAKSFGLNAPPRVNLAVKTSGKGTRKNRLHEQFGNKADKNYQYKQSQDAKNKKEQSSTQIMY